MLITVKYVDGLPLARFEHVMARSGVSLPRQTQARWIIEVSQALQPLVNLARDHLLACPVIHMDETRMQVLKEPDRAASALSYMWVHIGGPPGKRVVLFDYETSRSAEVPERLLAGYKGYLMTDGYPGYNQVGSDKHITHLACWAHARRPFFALADIEASARRKAEGKAAAPISPLALEIVQRMDRLFEIERGINGKPADERRAVRQKLSRILVDELETRMRAERPKLSRGNDLAKAMDYMLKRWPAFTRFLDDGRVCLSNNAAERGLRGIALGRKSWLFAGSDRGGERAAAMYSLIVTAKMNDIDPQTWLADVLARIAGHPATRLDELLPWNWRHAEAALHRAA